MSSLMEWESKLGWVISSWESITMIITSWWSVCTGTLRSMIMQSLTCLIPRSNLQNRKKDRFLLFTSIWKFSQFRCSLLKTSCHWPFYFSTLWTLTLSKKAITLCLSNLLSTAWLVLVWCINKTTFLFREVCSIVLHMKRCSKLINSEIWTICWDFFSGKISFRI